jgi:DeoR/GlpR family transcriptional regulator of sugar metabolism
MQKNVNNLIFLRIYAILRFAATLSNYFFSCTRNPIAIAIADRQHCRFKPYCMLKRERQAFIVGEINVHNRVLSSDLSLQLKVSEDTVRRDLQELHEDGVLTKVHGGAISKSIQFSLRHNGVYSQPGKICIAQKALPLIQDGMIVLLSGGTTNIELIKLLPQTLKATFVTVSIPTALELMHHPGAEVIFIGNKLQKESQMAVGAAVIQKLAEIKADLCFLGTNSIDAKEGITDSDWEVVEVKKEMIKQAGKVVSLAIAEKLNTVQRLNVCPIGSVQVLVTDLEPGHEQLRAFRERNITIL